MNFIAKQKLPYRIPTSAYHEQGFFSDEIKWMRENTWQLVGTAAELTKPGDFITREVLGVPVIIRNFEGELVALSNVCAHRHSLIRSERQGNKPELSCQYHGWCYGSDGLTRKIPCAKDFAPIEREQLAISKYRCEKIGQLVFVALNAATRSLTEFLGPHASILSDRTGPETQVNYNSEPVYAANWKVAVENTLEAYHVQAVHPNTFRREPGEMRSEHDIFTTGSSFKTDMPFAAESRIDAFFQRAQSRLMRWLGRNTTSEYEHHHCYPNLLVSFTDAVTIVQSISPIKPNSSQSIVYQFGVVPHGASFFKRLIARAWGSLEATILKRILNEDIGMLPNIQAGLEHSPHVGTLGRCEERIAAFQDFWCDVMIGQHQIGDSNRQSNG